MRLTALRLVVIVALVTGTYALPLFAGEPTAAERAVALKARLAASQSVLRKYEWTETTIVSVNGKEQSRTRQRCSFGADGTLRKVPLADPAPPRSLPGMHSSAEMRKMKEMNAAKEAKKEDLKATTQEAMRLVHQYVPLNPHGLQAVVEEGKLSFKNTAPGKMGRLTIRDFLFRGDSIELDLNLTNNNPLSLQIYSFLESQGTPVTLTVTFGALPGAVIFERETVLEVSRQGLTITVQNADYDNKAP